MDRRIGIDPETVDSLDRPGMLLVATSTATNGAFEIVEDTRDAGQGPPPHVHANHDEAFYVLQGRFSFVRGHEEVHAAAGGFVFVPRGTRHAYRSEEVGSRLLFIVVPAGLSGFLREQGRLLARGMDVREAMQTLSDRFDTRPVD